MAAAQVMIMNVAGAAGTAEASITPPQMAAVDSTADSQNPRHGRLVRRAAAAAGAANKHSTMSAPTIWGPSATVAPTRARKRAAISRVGTPASCATAGSMVANRSGRAIAISRTHATAATTPDVFTAWVLIPKMLPNNTLTLAAPFLVAP